MPKDKSIYTQDFKNYIDDLIAYLRTILLVGEYVIKTEFSETPDEDDASCEDGLTTYATIISDDVYLSAYITIHPAMQLAFDAGNFNKVACYTLHELCHIITQPLVKWARNDAAPSQLVEIKDVNERQTQRIANAIEQAMPTNWWKPEFLRKKIK